MPPSRSHILPRVGVLVLSLTAAATFVASSIASAEEPDGGASSGPRFELTRTSEFLFRIDTETGQVWAVPVSGDGGWRVMGASPHTGSRGLYSIAVLSSGRRGLTGSAAPPRLLRTDQATGRAWVAPASPDGEWEQIAESSPIAPSTR